MSKRKAQVIPAPDDLKRRAVNFKKGLNLELSEAETRKVEGVVEAASGRFLDEIGEKLQGLRGQSAKVGPGHPDLPAYLESVRAVSLDIKGMGGTFGYPLMSAVAKSLNNFAKTLDDANEVQLTVIRHHIDALHVILAQSITGEGGQTESDLLGALHAATQKVMNGT